MQEGKGNKLKFWRNGHVYFWTLVIWFLFVAPGLVSAKDDAEVIVGVVGSISMIYWGVRSFGKRIAAAYFGF
ncbi:hypothetical protein [Dyella telluris]|uniref:Uncharacterized protein n=1 Tax=Dyella telluris TaxID=2763498 RepID=A0A7G8Q4N3_9GAMM|nr:hypothetical protein [Dyella telluris]QNK01741.1 hypothetical protein H8F01_00745 [Dyella telluris]